MSSKQGTITTMGNSKKSLKIWLILGCVLFVAGATALVAGALLIGAGVLVLGCMALGQAWIVGHYRQ